MISYLEERRVLRLMLINSRNFVFGRMFTVPKPCRQLRMPGRTVTIFLDLVNYFYFIFLKK